MYVFLTNLLAKEEERVRKEKVEDVGTDHGIHICLMPGSFYFGPSQLATERCAPHFKGKQAAQRSSSS